MKTESLNQRKQEIYKKEYQFKVSVHNMDKYLKVSFKPNVKELIIKKNDHLIVLFFNFCIKIN